MTSQKRSIEALTPGDLEAFPVWQYVNADRGDDMAVRPVKRIPVKNLTGRIVGTQVQLSNGARAWALIGNINSSNPKLTQHFLTLSIFRDGCWFAMARYHDLDVDARGPHALAAFLGLRIDEVFPISYDISQFSLGDQNALVGRVEKNPKERLTRAQIMSMSAEIDGSVVKLVDGAVGIGGAFPVSVSRGL